MLAKSIVYIFLLFGFILICISINYILDEKKSFSKSILQKEIAHKENLNVGMKYQGGQIVYLYTINDVGYKPNENHGLIASIFDQSNGIRWNNSKNILTNADSSSHGNGLLNTNLITSIQGKGIYAAQLCSDLELNGYDDWFLPSLDQLRKLFTNKDKLTHLNQNGYWSSSETQFNHASGMMSSGFAFFSEKKDLYAVRAFREF